MRNGTNIAVEMENGTLLSEIIALDVADKIIGAWREEFGPLVDFGGGVKDVTCYDLLEACSHDPKKFKKFFPFLTASTARDIISLCEEAVRLDP